MEDRGPKPYVIDDVNELQPNFKYPSSCFFWIDLSYGANFYECSTFNFSWKNVWIMCWGEGMMGEYTKEKSQ
jgi:hypothetical protein